MQKQVDVIIIGAGAAGLMCAIEAGKRGRRVLVLEHAKRAGKKILMSGGGYCNFTNYHVRPDCYISHNPHFCKSALSRYTPQQFIELVEKYNIPYHEKTLGQLFCDNKAIDIVNLLLAECEKTGVDVHLQSVVENVEKTNNKRYKLKVNRDFVDCESLVIASGGLSIPTLGASPFGYKIAGQFGINVWPTRAGLVPLTLHSEDKAYFSELSGVSFDSIVSHAKMQFRENCLFTHRGISGPAILQISSYWTPGEAIQINALPEHDLFKILNNARENKEDKQLKSLLTHYLPKRLIEKLISIDLAQKKCVTLTGQEIKTIVKAIQSWELKPNGIEGYRTAEVTIGGVDCNAISSKTMESFDNEGLYFIGEVLDVAGWLGGYNFQWAWASGFVAGGVV